MSFKILNTMGENFTLKAKSILGDFGEVDYKILSQSELERCIDQYDAVLIGLGLVFDENILERAKKLKVIATATTGLDHIDVKMCSDMGVEILSLREEERFLDTITGTSELAFALLLDLARFVPWSFDAVKRGEWKREEFRGHTLRGKTLGIVGMGRLGRIMSRQAVGFGIRVIYYDPNKKEEDVNKFYNDYEKYKKVSFDQLLEQSDAISIHVHLNKETEGMFGVEEFNKMKKDAYLINTSRGKIIDEVALLDALKNKQVAGYGTDVMAGALKFEESGKASDPLIDYAKSHRNVIVLPHTGGMTVESREATDIFIAQKLSKYLSQIS